MASMTAPVSCARFQPNSSEMGLSTTPKRNRAPEAMVSVMARTRDDDPGIRRVAGRLRLLAGAAD